MESIQTESSTKLETCPFCNGQHGPPFASSNAIRRFKEATGLDFSGIPCPSCINRIRFPKSNAPKLAHELAEVAVQVAAEAIRDGDYESFAKAEVSIESQLQKFDNEINRLVDEANVFNVRRSALLALRERLHRELSESPSASYFVRRKEADKHISKSEVRIRIFSRDRYRCRRCKCKSYLSIDHIVSVKNGGGDNDENLQTLCSKCNSSKGTKTLADFWPADFQSLPAGKRSGD